METVTVHVEADVNPTEDPEKVKQAIDNIVGNATFTSESAFQGSILKADAQGTDSLIKFRNVLRNDRIRDAARKLLNRAVKGNQISFYLNKQVACSGHISFSEESSESPLGPIRVVIETDNPRELVGWLAEKTEKK
ncbi:MAG: RNA-binding domain-containing protein [Candidatus Bathyarchaeia archaeon]|jgi:predicted RNA binding protein with dsRBD fold (UPF0201 family)